MASHDRNVRSCGWLLSLLVLLLLSLLAYYFDWFKVEDVTAFSDMGNRAISSPLPKSIPDTSVERVLNYPVEIVDKPVCEGVSETDGQSQEAFVAILLERIEAIDVENCAEPVRQLAAILFELKSPDSRVMIVLDNIARNDAGTASGQYAQDALDNFYRKETGEVTREEHLYQMLMESTQAAQPTPGDMSVDANTTHVKAEPDPAVIAEIVGMAQFPETENQRKFAVGLLRQYQPESAINVLDGFVADDDESVSYKALKDLSYMLGDQGVDNDQILTLIEQATDDPRDAIASEAVRILASWHAMQDEIQANSAMAEAPAYQSVDAD